jgi:hypothetical protein
MENEKMEQMLIIAGGVALGGLAVIYRKPLAVGLLGLTGFVVLLVLGLWAANAFTEPVIQYLIAMGRPDARAYLGVIWSTIGLLTPMFVFYCVLQLVEEIRQIPGGLGRMQRLRKARSVAKGAAARLAHLAGDPLENYDFAQSCLAHLLQYHSTLPPDEAAYAVLAPVVEQGRRLSRRVSARNGSLGSLTRSTASQSTKGSRLNLRRQTRRTMTAIWQSSGPLPDVPSARSSWRCTKLISLPPRPAR